MPSIKLGASSSAFPQVCAAFEEIAGLPVSSGANVAWLNQVVTRANQECKTDIRFDHEDWGYHFVYTTPESAVLLGAIKQKHNL